MAYTYLIGWSKLNKWYYGCRISFKAHPSELWKGYFTSSKYVKQFREFYGEPDIIQIRKTFENKNKCRSWESKVLKRMKVMQKDMWINKTDNECWPVQFGIKQSKNSIEKRMSKIRGTIWVTNGVSDFRVKIVPPGFYPGRTSKPTITDKMKESSAKIGKRNKGKLSGGKNPASKRVAVNGTEYETIRQACKETGISRYKLFKNELIIFA